MKKFVFKRLASVVPIVFLIAVISFLIVEMLPGDPALAILGEARARDEASYQALREQMGLDQPLPVRFAIWLGNVIKGDFGVSTRTGEPVIKALVDSLWPTLSLIVCGIVVAVAIGLPSGIISAIRPNTRLDSFFSLISTFGIAMPGFWFGMVLIYVFSVYFPVFPPSGYVHIWEDPLRFLRFMTLPTLALGLKFAAVIQRQTRSAMQDTMKEDYIRTAWSKGLNEKRVVLKHALRNSIIPVLTIIGMQIGRLFGGSVTIEIIFRIPGMGRLAADSVLFRDFQMVQGVMIFIGCAVVFTNLLTDIIYGFINPRIRYD